MPELTRAQIVKRAEEAYAYFYPLITMDVTRRKFTDPGTTGPGHSAPNTLGHVRQFPPGDFRAVVAPNFDTLYSSAWIDLSQGPLLLTVPDSGDRYYLLPFLDMWTNAFAVPGKRTTGTGPQKILLVPPGYEGDIPEHTLRVDAPTTSLWLIGRTQTNGPADYAAVNEFQDGMSLTAADGSAPDTTVRASVAPASADAGGDPLAVVNGLNAVDFFSYAARLLGQYPPQPTDFNVLSRIAPLGIVPGEEFDVSGRDASWLAALEEGAKNGFAHVHALVSTMARITNGWAMNTDTMGVYGNFYGKRAAVAIVGLGANPPEDAVYPLAVADATGQPIVGERDYVQHFAADELPPAGAFWSVTMYDAESFQAPNPLNRFALGDRDPLHFNDDGSLDMYYGPNDPGGDKTANWLPAPAGPLRIIMRLYAPAAAALDGRWNPPAITAL